MKRMTYFVMALALVLGFTQCKKEQPTPQTQGVRITLNVNGGNSNSRVIVDPNGNNGQYNYATVNFETGDVIYVGYNNAYVGTLTYSNGTFSGSVNISETVDDEHLHFYFLGGVGFEPTVDGNTATVVISDQTQKLPVISYSPSKEVFTTTNTSYSAKLQNKISIMKFNVDTPSTAAICITGMNNKVTVNFANPTAEDNGFIYSQADNGLITMPAKDENNVTWAIVLPQNALAEGAAGSLYTADNAYTGTRPAMEAIEMNKFLNTGVALEVNTAAVPAGIINGLFSVSATQKVYFSQGNLQYIGSAATPYWKFADNQWDYLGTTTSQNSNKQNVDRDLFGWGTSGWNNGNVYYQPYDTQNYGEATQGYGYGPTDGTLYTYNLTGTYANADWGVYNPISIGGNQENSGWRTLTKDEWAYVFNSRTDAASKKGHGNVNGVNGMILLPDAWTLPEGLSFTSGNSNWANVYNAVQWAQMEANGAVFLPAAGSRNRTTVGNVGSSGLYWSASYYNNTFAYNVNFSSSTLRPSTNNNRANGYSVRLARNAQ